MSSTTLLHTQRGAVALETEAHTASVSNHSSVDANNSTNSSNVGNDSSGADTGGSGSTSMADTFLTLLVAEIQNQGPTSPTDPSTYITQLSSMTQVAMSEEMSVRMNTNSILMSNLQVMALGNLVGTPIMVQTTTLDVGNNAINGRISLGDACTTVNLHLTDEVGNDYDIPLGPQSPGEVSFNIDPADYGISPGEYQVSVVTNTGEEEVPVEVQGVVDDVRIPLDSSTPLLNVTGIGEVPFTMISQFGIPDSDRLSIKS